MSTASLPEDSEVPDHPETRPTLRDVSRTAGEARTTLSKPWSEAEDRFIRAAIKEDSPRWPPQRLAKVLGRPHLEVKRRRQQINLVLYIKRNVRAEDGHLVWIGPTRAPSVHPYTLPKPYGWINGRCCNPVRIAWEAYHRSPPPDDMQVVRTCGNPLCLAKPHLTLEPKPKTNQRVREDIRDIDRRNQAGESFESLAREYEISGRRIKQLIRAHREKSMEPMERVRLHLPDIDRRHRAGATYKELAERYGLEWKAIRNAVRAYRRKLPPELRPQPDPDIPEGHKRCTSCREVKPLTEFNRQDGTKYRSRCKPCRIDEKDEYLEANPERKARVLAQKRERYHRKQAAKSNQ